MSDLQEMFASAIDAPAFFSKTSIVNDSITGIIRAVSKRQTRNPKDNSLQYWEDGSPMEQVVVIVESAELAKSGDDGARTIYIKWWGDSRKGIATAVQEAGAVVPTRGDRLTVTYTGEGEQPKNPVLSKPKLYTYKYEVAN